MKPMLFGAVAATVLLLVAGQAQAQWTLNGVKVYYNAGNVGIGTSNPNHQLEVRSAGSRAIFGVATAASGTTYGVFGQSNAGSGRGVYGLANKATGTNYGVYGKTNSDSGYAGYFVGKKNYMQGRLGLGRKNPTQKLDVNGNIRVSGWVGSPANRVLDLRAGGKRAMRLETVTSGPTDYTTVIGGAAANGVADGILAATIAGGGDATGPHMVSGHFGTISGGYGHTVSAFGATIGGGSENVASSSYAMVAGGINNQATGISSVIGGGNNNTASGTFGTIPGGNINTAAGANSFAAGLRAKALGAGTFVWGDSTSADVSWSGDNGFIVRASGGMWFGTTSTPSIPAGRFLNTSTGGYLTTGGTWTNASSRDLKENFEAVDARDVLNRVATLPIQKWNYKVEGEKTLHIGPTAEDFAAAFGLGNDEVSIATVDADGIALASIQGLHSIVREKDAAIQQLESLTQSQQMQIEELLRRMVEMEAKFAASVDQR